MTEPGPPGASTGFRWSGVPWWLVALIATIGFFAFKVVTDPKWRQAFDFILQGLSMTLIITAAGFVIAVVLGLIIGLARISKNLFLSNLAMYYIEFIRGVPVIVTIFMFSLVIWGQWLNDAGVPVPSQAIRATMALGLIYAAFIAEVFRAGIESISTGQREAGESVGLSKSGHPAFHRAPPGHPQHHAGTRQRPHRPAEGLLAGLDPRRSRSSPR